MTDKGSWKCILRVCERKRISLIRKNEHLTNEGEKNNICPIRESESVSDQGGDKHLSSERGERMYQARERKGKKKSTTDQREREGK